MVADLYEVLRRCEKWLDRYRGQGKSVGEENTKAGLIEPILEALGWDIRDPDEVHREYRRLPSDNPVDYALLLLRNPRLFVEAKGVSEHLDDPKWANQTIAYATAAGVEWVALTNGAEWRIYNAHAPVPIEKKLFRSVEIDKDRDDAVSVLQLLGKDNMGENRIEELWKGFFVDRQVREVLVDLFSGGEPAKELVAAVRHRVPGLTLKDIRSSLTRARAIFEFPVVPATSTTGQLRAAKPQVGAWRVAAAAPAAPKQPSTVGVGEKAMSLADLISGNWVSTGDTLETDYFGTRSSAEVLPDGRVKYKGTIYKTLSAAGEAVKVAVRGSDIADSVRATDGWSFWRTRDNEGALRSLKEIRRQAAGGS